MTAGETLTFSKSETSTDNFWRYAWYDENKTFIGRRAVEDNEFQWTVPEGAYFLRASYPTDSYPQIEKGEVATDWSPAPEDGVSKDELISEINIQADRQIFRVGDNRLMITEDSTYLDNAVIKSAHIADLAVTGAKIADASISSAKIINLDVDQLRGNKMEFISGAFRGANGDMTLDGYGLEIDSRSGWTTSLDRYGMEILDGGTRMGIFRGYVRSGTTTPISIGIGVDKGYDLILGYNNKPGSSREYPRALSVDGSNGDLDIYTANAIGFQNGAGIYSNDSLSGGQHIRINKVQGISYGWGADNYISILDGDGTKRLYVSSETSLVFAAGGYKRAEIGSNFNIYQTLNMNNRSIINQSDIRLKENIRPIDFSGIEETKKLSDFYYFNWKKEYLAENTSVPDGDNWSMIAQFSPFLVENDTSSDHYLSINLNKQVNLNTLTNKELIVEVENLQTRLDQLEQRLEGIA